MASGERATASGGRCHWSRCLPIPSPHAAIRSPETLRIALRKCCGQLRPGDWTPTMLRKTSDLSFVFPQRNPQARWLGTAILSRPLQPDAEFSARIYYCNYYLKRTCSKEETWS